MTQKDPRLIETPVRLSTSKLWQIQRNYFSTMGIQAWKDEVPFYISSNAFIGHRYAILVVNFIKDWRRLHPSNYEPFYIAELGSGTGKFSFYFLKSLKNLLDEYHLNDVKFCYFITDLIEKNIEFCQENSCFSTFIQAGELDFSLFDVEKDIDFNLKKIGKKFSELNAKTPLIIIANYTFDCVKHDSFLCENGKLKEERVGLRSRYKNFDIEKAQHLNELKFDYQSYDMDIDSYYQNPILTDLLKDYQKQFQGKKSLIMMPLGAFQFIDNMNVLTKGNFFMIAGDKGISSLESLPLISEYNRVTYDGCFSFMLNFHAMGRYIKNLGGDYLHCYGGNDFEVNIFILGGNFVDFYETNACYSNMIAKTGPEEFCYIFDEFSTSAYRFAVRSLLSILRFSEWDPGVYANIHERLMELLPTLDALVLEDIKHDLQRVKENIYTIALGDDVYNLLGIFYQSQQMNVQALELYLKSLEVYGDHAAPHNNLAMIYEGQKNFSKALVHYQKSYEIDKTNQFAKRKISTLLGKPYWGLIFPFLKGLLVFGLVGILLYMISH